MARHTAVQLAVEARIKENAAAARQVAMSQRYREEERVRVAEESRRHRAAVEARLAAESQRQQGLVDARLARERAESAAIQKTRESQHAAKQASQVRWAKTRDELQAAVTEILVALRSARARMDTASIAEAGLAAGEAIALEHRHARAEAALQIHMRQQPA